MIVKVEFVDHLIQRRRNANRAVYYNAVAIVADELLRQLRKLSNLGARVVAAVGSVAGSSLSSPWGPDDTATNDGDDDDDVMPWRPCESALMI